MHPFLGPLLAFLYSWLMILLIRPTSMAVGCLSSAKYTVRPIMDALGKKDYGDDEELLTKLMAVVYLGFIIGINSASVKVTLWFSNAFTVAKLAAIGILIGIGVYQLIMGKRCLKIYFSTSPTDLPIH